MSEVDNDENEQASTGALPRKPWTAPYVIVSRVGHTAKIIFKLDTALPTQFGPAS